MTVIVDGLGQTGTKIYASVGALPAPRLGAMVSVDDGTTGRWFVGLSVSGTATWVELGNLANVVQTIATPTNNEITSSDPTATGLSVNVAGPALTLVSPETLVLAVQSGATPSQVPFAVVRATSTPAVALLQTEPDGSTLVPFVNGSGEITVRTYAALPAASSAHLGAIARLLGGSGVQDTFWVCVLNSLGVPVWNNLQGAAGVTPVFATPTIAYGNPLSFTLTGAGTSGSPYQLAILIPANTAEVITPPDTLTVCDVTEAIGNYVDYLFTRSLAIYDAIPGASTLPPAQVATDIIAALGPVAGLFTTIIGFVTDVNTNTTGTINGEITLNTPTTIKDCLYCALEAGPTTAFTPDIATAWAESVVSVLGTTASILAETYAQYILSLDAGVLFLVGATAAPGSGGTCTYPCPPENLDTPPCFEWRGTLGNLLNWHAATLDGSEGAILSSDHATWAVNPANDVLSIGILIPSTCSIAKVSAEVTNPASTWTIGATPNDNPTFGGWDFLDTSGPTIIGSTVNWDLSSSPQAVTGGHYFVLRKGAVDAGATITEVRITTVGTNPWGSPNCT